MGENAVLNEIKELTARLSGASRAYYTDGAPVMTDYEYDKLYDRLRALEEESGIILSGSPTRRVGDSPAEFLPKAAHKTPLLSLGKTKSVEELVEFLGENDGVLSLKLDGLTIALSYENGELAQGLTRGNGEIGEDVTANCRFFKNIPLRVNYNEGFSVRGEAVISYADFESVSDRYKNPRNLASGTVRQLDPKVLKEPGRAVNFLAFGLVSGGASQSGEKSGDLEWLRRMGFETAPFRVVTRENAAESVAEFQESVKTAPYASDGLVLTINSKEVSRALGRTSKFPKDSIAFKWRDETAETRLLSVEWNTSRTGLINPVAVFEPVELEGTLVRRAALHNLNIIENLQLGIGDAITVYKANMIIPQIAENLTRSGRLEIPEKCPVCGGASQIISQNDSKELHCPNSACRAQLVRAITHFASRDAMNIEGFSEQTAEKFVERGFLTDVADIFKIGEHFDEIKAMDGFGEKSAKNLSEAVEKARNAPLFRFIHALGIPRVGLAGAKLLCKHFGDDPARLKNAAPEELEAIDGFGEVISASLRGWFASPENARLFDRAAAFINIEKQALDAESGPLAGKTFVITGKLQKYPDRKALQAEIERLGGKVSGSVSSKTEYLINNDASSQSAKNKKARELGVSVVTEREFLELAGLSD
ncbi:MAG: NAD-dependent DNA ligase LigA [Clostridiales bacterium]|nr:NAD-dependent DNA ligase LigA [Clostridiales bacterium]